MRKVRRYFKSDGAACNVWLQANNSSSNERTAQRVCSLTVSVGSSTSANEPMTAAGSRTSSTWRAQRSSERSTPMRCLGQGRRARGWEACCPLQAAAGWFLQPPGMAAAAAHGCHTRQGCPLPPAHLAMCLAYSSGFSRGPSSCCATTRPPSGSWLRITCGSDRAGRGR